MKTGHRLQSDDLPFDCYMKTGHTFCALIIENTSLAMTIKLDCGMHQPTPDKWPPGAESCISIADVEILSLTVKSIAESQCLHLMTCTHLLKDAEVSAPLLFHQGRQFIYEKHTPTPPLDANHAEMKIHDDVKCIFIGVLSWFKERHKPEHVRFQSWTF